MGEPMLLNILVLATQVRRRQMAALWLPIQAMCQPRSSTIPFNFALSKLKRGRNLSASIVRHLCFNRVLGIVLFFARWRSCAFFGILFDSVCIPGLAFKSTNTLSQE